MPTFKRISRSEVKTSGGRRCLMCKVPFPHKWFPHTSQSLHHSNTLPCRPAFSPPSQVDHPNIKCQPTLQINQRSSQFPFFVGRRLNIEMLCTLSILHLTTQFKLPPFWISSVVVAQNQLYWPFSTEQEPAVNQSRCLLEFYVFHPR